MNGIELKNARKAQGINPHDAAKMFGVSVQTLWAWERGSWSNGLPANIPEHVQAWVANPHVEGSVLILAREMHDYAHFLKADIMGTSGYTGFGGRGDEVRAEWMKMARVALSMAHIKTNEEWEAETEAEEAWEKSEEGLACAARRAEDREARRAVRAANKANREAAK